MYQNSSDIGTYARKVELTSRWRSVMWALAAIAMLLFPLFMINSLAQAATDVSPDAFPIRQCSVNNRINKITNNEMVSRFDGLNQSGDPEPVYFTGSAMQWVEYSDGSARLMGDMIAIDDPTNSGFTVDVTFTNKAIANGNLEYDSFFGTLTGFGGYDGAVVSVQPSVKAPSFRFWNNGPDAEGWIQWVVDEQSTGGQLLVEAGQSGVWSFSLNPNCKTMPAPTYTPVPKEPAAIGDVVFKDNNQNGIQDADDEGIAGIEVLLWTDDDEDGAPDTVIATQTTDANGMYQFQGLSPHVTYFVQFIIPADAEKLFTTQDAGGDDTADSDPDPATGIAGPINVAEGEENNDIDAGLVNSPASIGDRVWRDTNRNGIQDDGEPGEDGVVVYLLDGNKAILDSTTTAGGGFYSFSNLNPKEVYRIRFEAPANTGFTSQDAGSNDSADSDAAIDTGQTDPISLAPGENNDDIDAGIVNDFVTLGDTVFKDNDRDGFQDADEPGIAGITVNLLDAGGNVLLTTTTDADGKYIFSVDPKQSYIIEVEVPDDKDVAPKDASPDDTADSDIGPDGQTDPIQPTLGENDSTIDAGLSNKGASIGDTVFSDLDGDGIQDAGEPGVGGVTVNLLSKDGTVLATDTTDAAGNYGFGDLDPKEGYIVQVVIPDGKDASPQDAGGDDAADSDIDAGGTTDNISLTPGEENPTIDAGLVNEPATLGDTVFSDLDGDGIQDAGEPGVAGVTVNLLDKAGNVVDTTTTDAGGNYSFTVDPKQSYVIEFVAPAEFVFTDPNEGTDDTADSDADPDTGRTDPIQPTAGEDDPTIDAGLIGRKSTIGDLVFKDDNGNGQQDPGEPGIEDVTVNLLDKAGNVVDTTTTGPDGTYGFSVDSTSSFVVQVVVPDGKGVTTPNTGDDATDSDIGPDGKTDPIEIGPSQSDDTIDAGLVNLPGTLNGVVFNDVNQNGIQDAGDMPVEGATVELITKDKATVLDSTTTGADGSYTFTGLDSKESYRVRFTAPADTAFTTQDAGGDDTVDSDADPVTGQTDDIVVPADGSTDNVDAGVVDQPGSITGTLFKDDDGDGVQDPDEPGIPGQKVSLQDKAGNPIASETTDANGDYSFDNLDPGSDYVVVFDPVPDTVFTEQDAGGDDDVDSDVDPTTGATDSITVPANGTADNVDAGVSNIPGSISGTVFDDVNRNGVQDASEPGSEGVTVNLLDKDGNVVATATTNPSGNYSFSGLDPKAAGYIVQVEEPAGKEFTDQNVGGDDTVDSDVDPATGQSDNIQVPANDTVEDVDAGLVNLPGGVTGVVWNDANDNNLQDAGEAGVAGVTVALISEDKGTVFATTTTAADGSYTLPVEDPKQSYRVRFTEPAAQDFVAQNVGGDDTVDSDADPTTGQTDVFDVPADGTVEDVDAGVRPSDGKAGGVVWKDDDADGIQDADEETLGGITVNLLAKDGTLIDSTETASDGTYTFPGVDSTVSYVVEFELPGDKLFTTPGGDSDVDPSTGQSPSVTVPADGAVDVSAGLVNKSGTLGDTVFKDDNENGIQDAGEGGVEGVTVRLLNRNGNNEIASTTTDSNGNYSFSVDPKETYIIEVVEPDGFDFSPQDAGGNDANDSDVDPTTGQTDPINVGADETDNTIDAGLVWEPGTIAGTAWKDNDKDGIQDAGEPGLEGITVNLWIAGVSGNMFASTETDSNGDYVFTNVNPKLTYNVEFEVPGDKEVTQSNAGGDDTVDSDITAEGVTKDPISVSANEDVTNIDAGFFNKSASIGDTVWNDLDRDGIQDAGEPGEPGVTVELLAKDGSVVATTTTDSDGNYLFTDVDPKDGYIIRFTAPAGKGFTEQDAGGDDTADSDAGPDGTTANITVDADEDDPTVDAGLVTVLGSISGTVTKDDEPGGAVGEPGVTVQLQDKAGNELDATVTDANGNYSFDGLEPGDQYVVVVLAPADKNFSSGDGTSGSITVTPGDKTTFNQGLVNKPATIGDRVFKDDDADGIQDAGEPGIAGITVNLMDTGKSVLQTTTTDADGLYSFAVDPKGGDYIIQFVLPSDKEFTTPNVGSDTEDSDVTDPATGQTDPVTVGADETNPTVDAGMVNKGASVGNFVFRDLDNDGIQDAGEPGIAGVTVILQTKDGTEIARATTGADGTYEFIGIDPKDGYEVQFVAPAGEEFTTPDVGTDDSIDSDAGPDGTTIGSIDVTAGEDNPTVDAGLQTVFDLALRKTIGEAEKLVLDGDRVVFNIEVCNQGNVPASDILIVDYIPGAFVLSDGAWTQVGDQAELTIAGPLAPGACTTVEIGMIAAFSDAVTNTLPDPGVVRAASAAPNAMETFEFVSNKAEIAQASDSAGNVRTSDVDSTYDRVELNDPVIDDEINLTPAEGDEDDHDKSIVQVLPRDLATTGDVNADGARTAVDALLILRDEVDIAVLPISDPGRSGIGSQEEIDQWCGTIGAFGHNTSTVSGDFDGDGVCSGADYGDYVCDVSGDNQCNAIDALFILQCDVGLSNTACPQP